MNLNFYVLIGGILTGWLTGFLAEQRGRHWFTWFVIGFFMGIFAPILVYVLPPLNRKDTKKTARDTTIEVEAVVVPPSTGWFYLDREHQQIGPLKLKELKKLWNEKALQLNSYIWNEIFKDWKKVEEAQDILRYFQE